MNTIDKHKIRFEKQLKKLKLISLKKELTTEHKYKITELKNLYRYAESLNLTFYNERIFIELSHIIKEYE